MLEMGLLEETKKLLDEGLLSSKTASQAIAYKEFLPYFNGESTIDDVSSSIKLATRHYAKRQMIWFRRYSGENIYRLIPDREDGSVKSAEALANEAVTLIK